MDPNSANPVTPQEIIELILEDMQAEAAPSYYTILVRSVFNVYLQIDDYERLQPAFPLIRKEAVTALNERLSELNKPKKASLGFIKPARKKAKRHEALGEWVIEFHENTDEDAKDNPLVIHSAFALPKALEDRAGAWTERVSRRAPDGQTSSSTKPVTDSKHTRPVVYAILEYEDDSGGHTYEMTKNLVKIGRGGKNVWVDLSLQAPPDVSREHVQVRRDGATGGFFLKDLSKLGTSVDGKAVPASVKTVDGNEVDENIEVPLKNKAKIGLAGVVFLKFKAVKQT